MVEDDVVRRVVGLADFLEDDAALTLQLLGEEGGVGEDVADDVGAEIEVLLQQLDVIGGLFTGGVGVDVAADIFHSFGDLGGAAALGALEGHVFEEMADAVLGGVLVAGAAGDIGAEGDGLDTVHLFGDDTQAGGQGGDADGLRWSCMVPCDESADGGLDAAQVVGCDGIVFRAFI